MAHQYLRKFLDFLKQSGSDSYFVLKGTVNSTDPVMRSLEQFSSIWAMNFSAQATTPLDVIHIINQWAHEANANVKTIVWQNSENVVNINLESQRIIVTSESEEFISKCADYANQLQYATRFIQGVY
jgi:hypothetical protein